MNILHNGIATQLEQPANLAEALTLLGYDLLLPFAVAVNGQFVPRNSYREKVLKDADDVEVVSPMQGG